VEDRSLTLMIPAHKSLHTNRRPASAFRLSRIIGRWIRSSTRIQRRSVSSHVRQDCVLA
jgi:hypothetical protein